MATLKNTTINDTGHLTLPAGTTAQRPASPVVGMVRYNTTLGFSEQYTADGWQGIAPPPITTSISPTNFNGEQGTTITVNGSNFDTGASVQFILSNNTVLNATTTTRVSSSQLTATIPRDILASESPIDVRVTNGSGLTSTLDNILTCADVPVFTTASGSIGQIYDRSRSTLGHLSTLAATDAAGGSIASYAIVSGSIPAGLSFNTTTAALSGTANAVGTDTTSTFTVRATDNAGNTTDRSFSITVRSPIVQSFTSTGAGTFSVPTGVSSARVLVIAGGGSGGTRNSGTNSAGTDGGAGGGAGGMIDHPGFPLTPGGSVPYSVGAGAPTNYGGQAPGSQGTPSTFGSLTAIGGGFGGCGPLNPNPGGPGGSGGGEGGGGGSPGGPGARGPGVQPSQPGDSGTFGYGNPGGFCNTASMPYTGAGGGGAGAAGSNGSAGQTGAGGSGRNSDITGSTITYAGGGGGGAHVATSVGSNGGAGGGGPGNSPANPGDNGGTNTGGGGGGGPGGPGGGSPGGGGGAGGPGIIVLRY